MSDKDLCAIINRSLPPAWHPFEPLGDGEEVHSFLKEAYIGVRGKIGVWVVVRDEDCLPVSREVYPLVDTAMIEAEALASEDERSLKASETSVSAERLAGQGEGRR